MNDNKDNGGDSRPYRTLLLDMDGVLAEVSKSYREAILRTCHHYGAKSVTHDTITEWKARGNANDDWKLSRDLIHSDPDSNRDEATLEKVTETFEQFYQGTEGGPPGLYTLETLIPSLDTIRELSSRSRPGGIGIVTGRPRSDCDTFLKQHELEKYVAAKYCMEDGPSKPDPFPVRKVCQDMGVEPTKQVVLIGDTPDDVSAAISAGCSAVGVITPEAAKKNDDLLPKRMKELGADRIMSPGFADIVDMFPPPPSSQPSSST